jgi:predicted  nucleic acid-binding Zn-ribbon protein
VSDINNAKSTIADKIHQAVSSLLETEMRLNNDLSTARSTIRDHEHEIQRLQELLANEQTARRELEGTISKIAELVR